MKGLLITAAVLSLWGCGSNEKDPRSARADSIRTQLLLHADSLEKFIEVKPVTYSTLASVTYVKLINDFGKEGADVILKLNRLDRNHVNAKDTLIVPDTLADNFIYYSPFPLSLKPAAYIEKILFISQTIQAFAAYEYGVLTRWGPASTGKRSTPTPNGLFHTNWKAEETISTSNDEWLLRWNFNIESIEGIAIHQYDMPGYPASHSCARLLEEDAVWFYNWAEQWIMPPTEVKITAYGTPVIIFGDYNFNGRKPWLGLAEDRNANLISREELERILSPQLSVILQRQGVRDSLTTETIADL